MNCIKCNTKLVRRDQKKFCSRTCSASYNNTLRGPQSILVKQKKSKTLKDRADRIGRKHIMKDNMYIKHCVICEKQFLYPKRTDKRLCSRECMLKLKQRVNKDIEIRLGGIWQRRNSRSKGERLLAQKLIDIGVNILTNKKMFNGFDADIILPDYNIAIHWNGAWHWKPIAGEVQLQKIKERDIKRYKAIEESGYVNLIIIDHKFSTPEQAADIHFRKLIRLLGLEPRPGDYLSEQV